MLVLANHAFQLTKLVRFHPIIIREADRPEPELARVLRAPDVDVGRLLTFVAVEMKPEAPVSKNSRHLVCLVI